MPIHMLLWLLVGAPLVALLLLAIALIRNKGDDLGNSLVEWVTFLIIVTAIAAPNLLWYKSVRDAMVPPQTNDAPLVQPVKAPVEVQVEAPAVFHPELMVQ